MAEPNRWKSAWDNAKAQGLDRGVLAESLGMERGRLNDLILGRAKARPAEMIALTGRRNSTLATYEDVTGNRHSFFTGKGMSLERLLETGQAPVIADEMSEERKYDEFARMVAFRAQYPRHPAQTRIYAVSPTLRRQFGR